MGYTILPTLLLCRISKEKYCLVVIWIPPLRAHPGGIRTLHPGLLIYHDGNHSSTRLDLQDLPSSCHTLHVERTWGQSQCPHLEQLRCSPTPFFIRLRFYLDLLCRCPLSISLSFPLVLPPPTHPFGSLSSLFPVSGHTAASPSRLR